jgi:glycosyltransferase involved in cell wall biosynthesis
MTLIEAMASGLAVVGTTTGGSCELLEDGATGLTFSPEDVAALTDHLWRLRHDVTECGSLALAGQNLVRARFGLETTVAQTEAFLRRVTESSARGSESHQGAGTVATR